MDDEYDEFMNMLLGSGAENMEEAMMRMFLGMGGGGANSSSGMCNEVDWENHSMGELFRAVRRHDTVEVETLLEQESYREGADELDGDGAGVLHNLALDSELYEEDAEAIVQAFKNAGADLDLRGGSMMNGNTPLHVAACYGNIAIAKALIDAGATADICDNFGKTPLNKADDVNSVVGEMTFNLIQDAVTKERSDPNYVDAVTLKANEIRLQAEKDWKNDDLDLAMENYQRLLQLPGCDEDYRNHANLAGCALQHAIEKAVSGVVGGRNSFKIAYKAASKAVELEPTFEIGWEEVARAYMGYRELPRAKQACKNGLKLFPESKKLKEIWSVLDQVGVPDEVVDHESQEFKDIYDRIYMERWVGPVGCDYCALNCMDEPRPDKCPFCGCPDKELNEDAQQMIICLTMYGKKDDSSINGEEDDDMKNNDDNSNDEDDDSSASLFYDDNSIKDDDNCEDVEMLAGAGGMEETMMRMFLGMSANTSTGLCNEDDWEDHPMGELFRAARRYDTVEVETLLEQESYREGVDELDGDGAGVLHNLALGSELTEEDAEAIVQAFKNAGADLDLRGGSMMSGNTPLHVAACYGHFAIAKALIDAGATADICDKYGKTPLHKVDVNSFAGQRTLTLIRSAVMRERSDPHYVNAMKQKANEIRLQAEEYWKEEEMDLALENYQRLLQLPGCNEDYRNHANLAGCALEDAIIKKTSGIIGGRNSFKIAYEAASTAVELDPTFEISWNELARAYMGYRELPRAKQACKNGLKLFPESENLREIWSVLDQAGVPDTVVDHESQEFKDIYERIYMKRWIGPVGCDYCELKCMDEPRPDKCPFCGCPDKELDDETDHMIICLTVHGKKDDSSTNGEEDDDLQNNEDNSFEDDDSENLEMPPLVEPCASNTNPFTFAAPSQSGSTSFDFGSPSNGTETKFVFGSPETKGDSK